MSMIGRTLGQFECTALIGSRDTGIYAVRRSDIRTRQLRFHNLSCASNLRRALCSFHGLDWAEGYTDSELASVFPPMLYKT